MDPALPISNDRLECAWVNGKTNSNGTKYYANGDELKCLFVDEIAQGRGILKNKEGTLECTWADGIASGKGVMTYTSGGKLECTWVNGKAHGDGVKTTDWNVLGPTDSPTARASATPTGVPD